MTTTTWENIYAQGKQLNLWPFSELVSAIMRETAGLDRASVRILELGCGAGNNIYFLAKSGFAVSGIDGSKTAIDFANKRLESENLTADLRVGDLADPPFPDDYFDYVVDRGALTTNRFETIRRALVRARDVLKPSGKIFSFDLYGKNHPGKSWGVETSYQCYDNFTEGYFAGVGLTSFLDAEDIKILFEMYREVKIGKTLVFEEGNILQSETFNVVATK